MSYIDRVVEANRRDLSRFVPLQVAGERVGHVRRETLGMLADWPEVFRVEDRAVTLAAELDRLDAPMELRTIAVDGVMRALHARGVLSGWREERYPVAASRRGEPLMLLERAALPLLGVSGQGVHLNGFVRDGDALQMWVGRRANDKPTWPGLLDQLVAGGQPAGAGLRENLIKECDEEAGIPPEVAGRATATGAITYTYETPGGLRPDVVYTFDLELPPDFVPVNRDGEVDAFFLWPVEQVMERVRETREFKFNCALVVIDFAIRHGLISPEHPEYLALVAGLRAGGPELAT
ncbi:MAG: DUF4743 domain-containing protein [Chromatiales bacterium]|nr:DUF4743 domain-containing protein [Chromatiales bacterium]